MSPPQMNMSDDGKTVVVNVTGEIDASNAEDLRLGVEGAMGHTTQLLAIDLSAITYLDSAGIHVLFRLGRELSERGAQLRIVAPHGSVVHETLRYADALRLFSVAETAQEAAAG